MAFCSPGLFSVHVQTLYPNSIPNSLFEDRLLWSRNPSKYPKDHRMWCQVGKLPQMLFAILYNWIPCSSLKIWHCWNVKIFFRVASVELSYTYDTANKVMKYSIEWHQHCKEIQKLCLMDLPKWYHIFPIMHCRWRNSTSKISILKVQNGIERGFLLPNTEKFTTFFENIKFGQQNLLLTLEMFKYPQELIPEITQDIFWPPFG